jgi:hypothetical protein
LIDLGIYLTTLIFTIVLVIPNIALDKQDLEVETHSDFTLLEAPKSPLLSFQDYAVKAAESARIDTLKFQKLVECESLWKADAEGDQGTSFGLLQFKESTFEQFKEKYGILNADINDPYDQMDLAAGMIADGYLFHWKNCARKIRWNG